MDFKKKLLFSLQLADIEAEALNRVIDLADYLNIDTEEALNIFIDTLTNAIKKDQVPRNKE